MALTETTTAQATVETAKSPTPVSVTARFFAAAEEAVGAAELVLELAPGATIRDALASASREETLPVLSRCSFLLNSEATTDVGTALHSGDTLDVLPPFAGG